MTLLITSVRVDTLSELESRSTRAMTGGAEAIELRIDTFSDPPALLNRFLKAHTDRTWIVTCRSRAEGGCADAPAIERACTLAEAVRGTGALIDFEFEDWRTSVKARQSLVEGLSRSDGDDLPLILSAHNFDGPFESVDRLVVDMLAERAARVAKIAFLARSAADSLAALDLMHEHGNRVCAIAMGAPGQWTRVLARKFGAWGTYCALDTTASTAPGQLDPSDMTRLFRWDAIGPATRVFGVIGDPVAHSMSPLMFNDWFHEHGVNAVYVPVAVPGGDEAFRLFVDGVRDRPWLDVGGFSVTIPHKQRAMAWCGDGADAATRSIGAGNTLTLSNEPSLSNTDAHAAIDSICAVLDCDRRDLRDIHVDILGAGGVARAIVYGLSEHGCRGTIFGRTLERATSLAEEFGFEAAPWSQRFERKGAVLVNATPIGMTPNVEQSPMPSAALAGCHLVFDTIYNPLETKLLAIARSHGVCTLNGLEMFVRQGIAQCERWTGIRPDRIRAEKLIAQRLGNKTEGDH